jgi:hypothetical protein
VDNIEWRPGKKKSRIKKINHMIHSNSGGASVMVGVVLYVLF